MRPHCVLALLATVLLGAPSVLAAEDPLAEAKSLVELGTTLVEVGSDVGNAGKVSQGVAKYRAAKKLFETELRKPGLTPAQRNRVKAYLVDVESRIDDLVEGRPPEDDEPCGAKPGAVR